MFLFLKPIDVDKRSKSAYLKQMLSLMRKVTISMQTVARQ